MAPLTHFQIVSKAAMLISADNSQRATAGGPKPNVFSTLIGILGQRIRNEKLAAAVLLIALLGWVVVAVSSSAQPLLILVAGIGFVFIVIVVAIALLISYFRGEGSGTAPSKEDIKKNTIGIAQRLNKAQRATVVGQLSAVRAAVAESLKASEEDVRAAVLAVDQGYLRIIPDLHVSDYLPQELSVRMPIGYGVAGRTFAQEKERAMSGSKGFGRADLEPDERKKVHFNLKWIISEPIFCGEPPECTWVLNVDGLRTEFDEATLQSALPAVREASTQIGHVLEDLLPPPA